VSARPATARKPAPGTSGVADAFGELTGGRRLVVCVGSGGVGKTTTAALIGVLAARGGRRAAVLTIDPARRLRDALGIDTLDDEPHRVPLHRALGRIPGSLDAMLLDAKRTFDTLIRQYAPSGEVADRVLGNRIYESISTALAGSQEYMAMERLHAIAASERYDVLVVDTPPTQHALDFLDAPARLTALLTSRAASILQNPASILSRESSRLAQAALSAVLRGLERFTGLELLRDVAELVGGLEQYAEGFQSRADTVTAFLRRPETTFVLVTTPEPARVRETLAFHRELARIGLPFGGFVVNRVLPPDVAAERPPEDTVASEPDAGLARKMTALQRRYRALYDAERAEIAALAQAAPDAMVIEVPLQADEPTSLKRLAALAG
jgi:anion-transporting  ArsA/GET3 family ATPase